MYLALIFSAVILSSTNALDELCTNNRFTKAAGYYEHPTDCDKFIQCVWRTSRLEAVVKQCSFPTYWNTDLLTCASVDDTTCSKDRCKDYHDGKVFEGETNCRGYWQCEGGRSQPKCCSLGYRFIKDIGCVKTINDDEECKDSCMGIIYEPKNETMNETTTVCEKEAIPEMPGFYKQYQPGFGIMTLPCAPGTNFDQEECSCILSTVPVKKPECKPEVHLTFMNNETTNNGYFLDYQNVKVDNGSAFFSGEGSWLSIPRFNNIEHSKALVIQMTYETSKVSSLQYPQVILSNSGCGILPSVRISENEDAITFEVGTTRNLMASTSVQQPTEDIKTVELKFVNGVLIGSTNNDTSAVAAEGFLRNVQCTLNIGYDQNMAPFIGTIYDFKVYLCDPEA